MTYEIQHHTLCQGWVNTWQLDDGSLETFATKEEAEAALQEFLADTADCEAPYEADEFRIIVTSKQKEVA